MRGRTRGIFCYIILYYVLVYKELRVDILILRLRY